MDKWTDNEIGAEGSSKISESLKVNTTLTVLHLGGDEYEYKWERERNEKWNEQMNR